MVKTPLTTAPRPAVLRASLARIAGTEPWSVEVGSAQAGSVDAGTTGVLVLHGLTGSPWEVLPLAQGLAAGGRTVAVPLLAGHGTDLKDLARTGWQDWLASARSALAWLEPRCDRVHLVGLSMGGLLALLLASQRMAAKPASLTLLAPAFTLGLWAELALRAVGCVGWPGVVGKAPPILAAGRPPAYHAMPVPALGSLLELQQVVLASHPRPRCPTLMLHGTADPTIPWRPASRVAARLLGPSLRHKAIVGAGHLLPRSEQAADVQAHVASFVREMEGGGVVG